MPDNLTPDQPPSRDTVRLPNGKIRVAYDVGEYLTITSLERALKFMRRKGAQEVMVWHNEKAVLKLYGIKDIEVLP